MKTALLVVSFGTTFAPTRAATIEASEAALQQAFPEATFFRAFTSHIVIKRMKANEGIQVSTPAQALATIQEQGFEQVLIQSLHFLPGIEYDRLMTAVNTVRDQFQRVIVGRPLLDTYDDFNQVISVLEADAVKLAPHDEDAVLYMGHGTEHHSFTAYACLDHMLMNSKNYVGAVESYPDLQFEIRRLKAAGVKRVTLKPLMLVAGDHAHHDMTGEGSETWQHQIETAGFQVSPILEGLGSVPVIQQLFVKHLIQAQEKGS